MLYGTHFEPVLAYARRRTDQPGDAADVVAETFLVAWRRLDQVPVGEESRLWLFGVARRVLANHCRGDRRRADLGERLRERLDRNVQEDLSGEVTDRVAVASALGRLSPADREVLMLHAWEQLEPREIAVVLELRPEAARARLSRARARIRTLLQEAGHDASAAGHVSDETRADLLPTPQEIR